MQTEELCYLRHDRKDTGSTVHRLQSKIKLIYI